MAVDGANSSYVAALKVDAIGRSTETGTLV